MKSMLVLSRRIVLLFLVGTLFLSFFSSVNADVGDADGGLGIQIVVVDDGSGGSNNNDDSDDGNTGDDQDDEDDSDSSSSRRSRNRGSSNGRIVVSQAISAEAEGNLVISLNQVSQDKIVLGLSNRVMETKESDNKIFALALSLSSTLLLVFVLLVVVASRKVTKFE